uniref:Uncharacterized protein n=1 Tax=Romanomermis culicivorax TaxID=13658 RepID=A0A915JYP1_ROMCU
MISIPLVSIFLILASFSFTVGGSLDEDEEKTFKIRGVVLCRNGDPFPENKEITLIRQVNPKDSDVSSFERNVIVSEGGHFTADVPVFKPRQNEKIEIIFDIDDADSHCSKREFQNAEFWIEEQKDQDIGEVKLDHYFGYGD